MYPIKKHAAMAGKAAPASSTLERLYPVTQAALSYARTVADTEATKLRLQEAYCGWRHAQDCWIFIHKNSPEWLAMMEATSDEYRLFRNARSRGYRAQKKLLKLAKDWRTSK